MKAKHHFSHPPQCTSRPFDRFLQQNNGWYTGVCFFQFKKIIHFSASRNVSCPHLKMPVSYPYCTSTVTNHSHGLEKQNKTKLLPHNFLSCLNIFSVFSWRKPDVMRLWERKFSWYLFPQQCWAAFGTPVPIVKLLILQSVEAAEAMLSDWPEKARWCGFEDATAGTANRPPAIPSIHSTYAEIFWEDKQDFAADDWFQLGSQFSLKQAEVPLATPLHGPKNGPTE